MLNAVYIKLSQATVLLPVFAGLLSYKKLNASFKILNWFFIMSIFFEIQASVLKTIYHNNMPGLHLFTFVEFITFSSVYFMNFSGHRLVLYLIAAGMAVFVLLAALDAFVINSVWQPNNISRTYSSVALVILSFLFYYFMLTRDYEFHSWQYPMFWFNTAVLVYFALNLFYFMLNNYLIEHAFMVAHNSMRVHAAINIIANCLFAKSFLCFRVAAVKL